MQSSPAPASTSRTLSILALMLAIALALTACGGSTDEGATGAPAATEVPDVRNTAVPDVRNTAVPDVRNTAVPEERNTAVPETEEVRNTPEPEVADEAPAEEAPAEEAPAEEAPAADVAFLDPAMAEVGATVWTASCASCHGDAGEGSPKGPGVIGIAAKVPDAATHIEIVTAGKGRMPAFGENLSAEEIEAVVAYLRATF